MFVLAAVRAEPGLLLHISVARQLNVDRRTARKKLKELEPRIKREQDALRLAVAATLQTDAQRQAAREAGLAQAASTISIKSMHMLLRLEPAMGRLAGELERLVGDGTIQVRDPDTALALISRFGRMLGRAVETAKASVELERLRVGAPDRHLVDIRVTTEPREFDPVAAAEDARLLTDAVERAKRGAEDAAAARAAEFAADTIARVTSSPSPPQLPPETGKADER